MADDASVLLLVGGKWQQLTDEPGNLVLSANEWGSDRCTFDLVRDTGVPWPDLKANTRMKVEVAGVLVWSGSIKETPARDHDTITVEGHGLQYSLDEWPYLKNYVHARATDWQQVRDPDTLFGETGHAEVVFGSGLRIGWNPGETLAADRGVGLTLDLGDTDGVKRVVIPWVLTNLAAENVYIYIRTHDDLAHTTTEQTVLGPYNSDTSATTAHTFATARRYLSVFLYRSSIHGAVTLGSGFIRLRVNSPKVFSATSYESGNASILNPDDVIKDALAEGGTLLSADVSQVAASSVVLPHFHADWRTAREVIEAANVPVGWVTKVDTDGRMVFAAAPTAPKYRVGAWSGYEWSDASLNNTDNLLSSVIVSYTDGVQSAWVERTQTVPALNGRPRREVLDVSSPIGLATAQAIGDAYLALRASSELHAELTVAGPDAVRTATGTSEHPAWLLRNTNELVRLEDRIDPDTGALGRTAKLATVTYGHDPRSATIELDRSRRQYEELLASYGLAS